MMLVTICAILASLPDSPTVMHEAVRSSLGEVISATNPHLSHATSRLILSDRENQADLVFQWLAPPNRLHDKNLPDPLRVGGGICWGVCDDFLFSVSHGRDPLARPREVHPGYLRTTRIDVLPQPIDETLAAHRGQSEWSVDGEIWNGVLSFGQAHGCRVVPLIELIKSNARELADDWNLWFDVTYTSLEDVTAVALRDGVMHVWNLHETGHPMGEWTARDPFATEIDGPFRMLRAGEDLANIYFVDEGGGIHAGFGADHGRIGAVRNFTPVDPDTLILVFEDQKTQKVGILHAAADDSIQVLSIDWTDPSFAEDFLTSIESTDLRTDLDRVADVIRDDRPPD